MKRFYLILSIIGFILPNIFVMIESVETGNILLYTNPVTTLNDMFANRISTIFAIDLFLAVVVFFSWSYREFRKDRTRKLYKLYLIWALTLLFGLAGSFPLFLYLREKR